MRASRGVPTIPISLSPLPSRPGWTALPTARLFRTFSLEHDIDGSEEYTSVLRFIVSDKRILAAEKEVIGD
jgi:hypothetical protein